MARRWRALVVGTAALAACGGGGEDRSADGLVDEPLLGSGHRVTRGEEEEAEAIEERLREATGAADVAVRSAASPSSPTPQGVRVAALTFRSDRAPEAVADAISRQVPLGGRAPRTVGGRPALVRDGEPSTFSSAALWVGGRRALLAYGGTTAEVEAVLAALLPPA